MEWSRNIPGVRTSSGRSRFAGYGVAVAAVLLAAAARVALHPWLLDRDPYLLFTVPVLAAAAFGGAGPAICAAVLGAALGAAWTGRPPLETGSLLDALIFLVVAAGIILLISRWRHLSAVSEAKAEQRARDAAQIADELNLLIDGANDYAIYMLDPEGRVTIWNTGAERMKGWSEEEIVGRPAAIFYPADAIAAGKPAADLARARAEGKFEQEDWRLRKDGSEFLAHVSITALHGEDGVLRGFGKVVRDVTDQQAAENAHRASASHLRSILSTVPDAMIVIDERGIILSFSAAAERLFGYAESEITGSNVSILMPSPDREQHDSYIARYLSTGERRIIGVGRIVVAARRDGSTFPMELSIGEALDEGQRVFTGFIRDLTERQQTQERLEKLQSELIHVARVSAMGTMASTLAHELNQPITAVNNYVEAVRDLLAEPDPGDMPMIREALNDAASEAMRAGHIVRRLRDFVSRGEVEKTVENLPALIGEAATLGLMGAREKGVDAHFDFDPAAASVLVDRVQIQQVLINLIRNAVDAMVDAPERHLLVTSRADAPGFVRVTVADTGSGVPPQVAEQLFTAFISTKSEGMGLGLSICRTIVEANGGRIWLDPDEGDGSRFHFTLVRSGLEDSDDG